MKKNKILAKHRIVENGFEVSSFNKRDTQPKLTELNAEVVNIFVLND